MAEGWAWYALTTEPAHEFRARAYLLDPASLDAQGLTRDDLHVLLPVRHVLTHQARRPSERRTRRSLVARPRIPGYLLMGVQPHARPVWRHILGLPYIRGVLSWDGVPKPIADVQLLIAMLADLRVLIRKRRRMKGRRSMEIASGPYQGRMANIVEIVGDDPEIWLIDRSRVT